MLSRLRRIFAPLPDPSPGQLRAEANELVARIVRLEDTVKALESERLTLLAEWVRLRDLVLRNVKRWGALRIQKGAGEDGDEDEDGDELDRELLRLKLSRGA